MSRNIFKPREQYKPFEYPEVLQFTDAMNKSFWVHSEVDFTADVQDFHASLEPYEQNAIKNALLAIAQIEVSVKTFWGNLFNLLPKPEFNGLGATFAECEFRHSEAYSRLLDVLGYTEEFKNVLNVPAIKNRITQLKKVQTDMEGLTEDQAKTLSILLFSILIENVSLFSQFATVLYKTRFGGVMKNVSNIIAWTSVDEQIHANAGMFIVKQIKEEQPDLFTPELINKIHDAVRESIQIEADINAWIFEHGDFPNATQPDLLAYMKQRVNDSMDNVGIPRTFDQDETELAKNLNWFEEEVFSDALDDFFAKRPVDYTKHDKSITENDLF